MSVNQIARATRERRPLGGPVVAFLAALAIAGAAGAAAGTLLHRDYMLPLAATVIFVIAAALALADRPARPHAAITYRDAAGALILIGLGVAALIEPAQLLRITGA